MKKFHLNSRHTFFKKCNTRYLELQPTNSANFLNSLELFIAGTLELVVHYLACVFLFIQKLTFDMLLGRLLYFEL